MTGWLSELHWLVWRVHEYIWTLPTWERLAILPLDVLMIVLAVWAMER